MRAQEKLTALTVDLKRIAALVSSCFDETFDFFVIKSGIFVASFKARIQAV